MRSRRLYALFGLVATLFGMAVGHLTAALLNPDSSPVLAVGSSVIDLTPVSVKEWAIRNFESDGFSIGPFDFAARNYDKVVLVGSVLVGVLVLAAIAGVLARRSFAIGGGMLAALVLVAGVAVLTRPTVTALDVVPVLLTLVAGVGGLWWLHCSAQGRSLDPRARSTVEVAKAEGAAGTTGTTGTTGSTADDEYVIQGEGARSATASKPSRRGVLIATGVLAGAAAVFGGLGRFIIGKRAEPEDVALPDPAPGESAPPLPRDLSKTIPGITPLVIANSEFYRVDTRLDTPVVGSEDWTLTVDGDVENKLTITFDELLEMPMIERDITLTCVSNTVGGKYVGGARWLGVPLKTVLDMAGVGGGADQILSTDFDGMTISTPLDLATDGRDAMICVGMNGEPLPRAHGFPVRLVIPGLYGFISATKWLTKLTLTTYAEQEAYWTERKWDTRAPIKPSARIDTPRGSDKLDGAKVVFGGVAWAQNDDGAKTVQVSIDGGAWKDAKLGPDVNNVYWRQWYFEASDLESGQHNVSARVKSGDGKTQTDAIAAPFPGGASGIHSLLFNVA
ncbi:sulfite oxidase [Nocardioides marinquilinus]|uniref:Sulfite oxidase n=1 Tax=Nocardioides marinquilinus TaxID=1210400 RepID=A0ABP9PD24_9ACTN